MSPMKSLFVSLLSAGGLAGSIVAGGIVSLPKERETENNGIRREKLEE